MTSAEFGWHDKHENERQDCHAETSSVRRWMLVDFDDTGLMQIQANDQHPGRDQFSDDEAIAEARKEAAAGDTEALAAVAAHDRDEAEIAQLGAVAL